MSDAPIYLDNHATTRVDPRVVEVMLPYFDSHYGNSGSTSHVFGWDARRAVDDAREQIAHLLGATPREIVFTSGATESNNLALRGVAQRHQGKGRHIISVVSEHPSVLDPLARLGREGFQITLLPVLEAPSPEAGRVLAQDLAAAIRPDTILVSVMWANNEIGAVHPMHEIAAVCRQRGVLLHSDATQAVGKLPVDLRGVPVDLLSFSAHKIYGPKGIGGLFVRRKSPALRLQPLLDGGGQEFGLRSGTLNVPGIVALAKALALCVEELPSENPRLSGLRDRLFAGLCAAIEGTTLNGPELSEPDWRLPGNLNVGFSRIDGEALLLTVPSVALSSGSACASEKHAPSHVLQHLGCSVESARSSIRFGLGRFTTQEEIDRAVALLAEAVHRLRQMSSLS